MVCFINGCDDRGSNSSESKKGMVRYNYVNIAPIHGADLQTESIFMKQQNVEL
jgi:hypothetical protein